MEWETCLKNGISLWCNPLEGFLYLLVSYFGTTLLNLEAFCALKTHIKALWT